ncbi:hypothetical protein RGQ29_028719 [Quercus rubra]|uniref:ABC transporter domain-containing protein n=1 Tax=Quercus rubra TaxID=3512 RepID=A0AAN7EUG9_QUERU|nr:hypothetical protein RGQ29_028719 [Quercus rubra]
MKFYLNNLFEGPTSAKYWKPNENCNLTSWVSGCEPGWACHVDSIDDVDFNNAKVIPARTSRCQSCCEGFFCPYGITCMIPCPLGSYCPLATLNKTTGVYDICFCRYLYQLPPGQPNHTCGGANIWADASSGSDLFCSAGSYCPTTTSKLNCSSGYKIFPHYWHYCRMGSTSEEMLISCLCMPLCKILFWSHLHRVGFSQFICMLIFSEYKFCCSAGCKAGLSTLLIIIYHCSDQVLVTRQRRLAKYRDAAARSAKERVKAHQRWQKEKDAAKKHASELQAHLSGVSPKKDVKGPHPITLDASLPSNVTSVEDKTEPNEMMPEFEDDQDSFQGFSIGTGDTSIKANVPKRKQTSSHSFKYAYAQLEKERAQQQEYEQLTFSGIVKMVNNPEIRKRPLIEIDFKDVTLTLKVKNKHLLRCVTGKIKPGHITAIMGPSRAGKTTFLSAVAGKTIGCIMTGSILINGKNDSIQSYKKIIGFVPQDDIVHGNLTVEENLWFSAKCRLSTDLSKPDKVLVVERVIEFLGLETLQSSLVGTVEKREILGGQRKRVNVGLEMVIEPSLLILDEPTSGLDSASSLQLIRALRHEALEGVNICMAVHQPSFALFNMLDDLILLAKGCLTVYHGPVKKVEKYFAGLGIHIPERVNPPDHLIDIVEGVVIPGGSSGVSHEDLAVRWMLRNGSSIDVIPVSETNPVGSGMKVHSFAGELWQSMKSNSKDLTNWRTPGLCQQYKYFVVRVAKQRLREARMLAMDYLILLLAGACLGSLIKVNDQNFGEDAYIYTIIAVSLLCKVAALRTFSLDKLHYWRESSSGMSSLAYFLSKDTVDHFNTAIKPAVYLSMFYFFTNPRSSLADNYLVLFCLVYCVTGTAYAFAIIFESGIAQLCSVLLPVVLTLVGTQPKESQFMKILAKFCYPNRALEAFIIANAERKGRITLPVNKLTNVYNGVWPITRCGLILKNGYDLRDWNLCIFILIGIISRVIAFLCMVTFQRK